MPTLATGLLPFPSLFDAPVSVFSALLNREVISGTLGKSPKVPIPLTGSLLSPVKVCPGIAFSDSLVPLDASLDMPSPPEAAGVYS